jgi:hypothetical protein
MSYVSSAEQIGVDRGMQQGMQAGFSKAQHEYAKK